MIPKDCRRLAEVDFPIAVVSKHSAREKSIRHGHPSTLHLWWARRPLAACRAMLLGLLLPDPCDPNCPDEFKRAARKALEQMGPVREGDDGLQKEILAFIGQVSDWDVANNPRWIGTARALVKAAHGEEAPLVVDPFAGGGSIPLEALRLGCEAFASDLNPVACLILKVMLEDIPRHGPELAEELRRAGKEIKEAAEKELSEFYPPDPDGARPIAYLWARTVRCESPNCGAEIPLVRSFWLSKKAHRRRALRFSVARPKGKPPEVELQVFEPASEDAVPSGTVSRAKATCPACRTVLSPERVRAQLRDQKGGADAIFDAEGRRTGGARLLAVVLLRPGEEGRQYRLPDERDYCAVWKAMKRLESVAATRLANGLSPVPDEPLPPIGTLGFRVQRYGMLQWGDLFTARQKLALVTLASPALDDSVPGQATETLALAFSRCTEQTSSLVRWRTTVEAVAGTFGRQALPIMWDFVEIVATGDLGSNYAAAVEWVAEVVDEWRGCGSTSGLVQAADSAQHPLPDDTAQIWFTDPPYYDAVPYADLSDFFLVWMKRVLPGHSLLRDQFDPSNPLAPKTREAVQDETKRDEGRQKDRAWFEEKMAKAFAEGCRILHGDGVGAVVFAHKTTEGWEALLSGMIRGGWIITASWPVVTERPGRLRSQDSAALATSVHLVCRPRPEDAAVGDWAGVLRELSPRVGDWMERLQGEGIRGADLVFACIGPALEVFSRYRKVETADGREVGLAEFLEKVWEVVGRSALAQVLGTGEARARNGAAGAVEEDARLTGLFLWTLQSTASGPASNGEEEDAEDTDEEAEDDDDEATRKAAKGYTLVYDVVRRFAQPLGINLDDWKDRIIEQKKGVVRLLSVAERAKQLFGEDGAQVAADRLEGRSGGVRQLTLFSEAESTERAASNPKGRRKKGTAEVSDESLKTRREATTLDRIHAAMLLQAGGRANALRALLREEIDRGPDFERLANALSALYPKDSEEKRLLDAMLLAVPR